MARAPQIRTMHPDAVRNAAVSFASELDSGELLTGTPVVTSSPSGLTISNVRVNTTEITVDGETTAIGQAVQFRVSGGTDGTTYNLKVSCGTDASPAQTLVVECTLLVLDD